MFRPFSSKFFFILFLLSVFFFLTSPILAQTTSTSNPFLQKQAAMKNGTGLESWTNEAMGSNMMSLFTGLVGEIPPEVFDANLPAPTTFIPGGAFGTLNGMIASLHTPPASGVEYIAQVKDNFLGKPAYAQSQGVGFKGLQFLLPLWRGFRNLVYVLSSIVFIAIGIMIMLRVKVSPQAVVTIQSAIPQLITTLILVTFSYAIAGLVIDLANFIQAFVIAILFSVKGVGFNQSLLPPNNWLIQTFPFIQQVSDAISQAAGTNTFDFKHLSNTGLWGLQSLTYRAIPGFLSIALLGALLGAVVTSFIGASLGGMVLGSTGRLLGSFAGMGGAVGGGLIGGLLIPLILCILVAFWLIKLFFGLLKCYVTIIFKIVLAPLEIGMGAFPNSKMGFSTWLTDIVANMAVFPGRSHFSNSFKYDYRCR